MLDPEEKSDFDGSDPKSSKVYIKETESPELIDFGGLLSFFIRLSIVLSTRRVLGSLDMDAGGGWEVGG